jgi:hypothetical protein
MAMTTQAVIWLDEDYDREHAPDGHSRYGAEVRRRAAEFADAWGDIAPVRFAVAAWRLATTLSPPYARWHRRILSVTCVRSAWDGSLMAEVTLAAPWPAELTWTKQWSRDRGWRDWPQLFGQYVAPTERDLTRSPHLRALLLVEAPVPLDHLPPAPEGPDPVGSDGDVARIAQRSIAVVARELNDLLAPMVGQLEAGAPADS